MGLLPSSLPVWIMQLRTVTENQSAELVSLLQEEQQPAPDTGTASRD